MIRRPPRSTLFPTRRSSDLGVGSSLAEADGFHVPGAAGVHAGMEVERGTPAERLLATQHVRRSEEHTSELQSLAYLVCRLLLEKKKNNMPEFTIEDTERQRS